MSHRTDRERQKLELTIQSIYPQSKLVHFWHLDDGISADMIAFEIEAAGGQKRKLILRRLSSSHLRKIPLAAESESKLLQIAQTQGLASPRAIHFDQTGQIFSRPYLILEYVEGEPDYSPSNLDEYLRQMASQLASIHSVDGSTVDISFLPSSDGECPELPDRRPQRANDMLAESRIRQALDSYKPRPQRNSPVLLHGDYWPGNILWSEGRLVAVIDWEDAHLGNPLSDLARSRSEIVWIFGPHAMESFTNHYQSLKELDNRQLAYWDLCAALRFIRLFGCDLDKTAAYFVPFGRQDITEESIRDAYHYFLTQAIDGLQLF